MKSRIQRRLRRSYCARRVTLERLERRELLAADITSGLVSYWKFDETAGDIAADSAGTNNATLHNWADDESKWVAGRLQGALTFGGGDDYVLTDAAINLPQYTIAFWLNVREKADLNPRVVTPDGGKDGWILINNEYGRGIGFYNNNGATTAQDPSPPVLGDWTHYAIVFDRVNSAASVYRDGVQVGSGVFGDGEPLLPWVIGHHGNVTSHTESLRGIMDDLRVYDRLLSDEDIGELASLGSDPPPDSRGLVHHYTFDETSGDIATDIVDANNGTLFNWAGDETKWVPGRVGGALRFNGGDDYVLTDKAIDFTQYTIAFWLNVREKADGNPRVVTPIGGKDGWVLINNEYGRGVGFYYNNGSTTAQDPSPPVLGDWTHYAITFDRQAASASIYRDGVLVSSGVFGDGEPLLPWVIGHHGNVTSDTESLRGTMDDLRIYDLLLSEQDIVDLASMGSDPPPPPVELSHRYSFDETSGDIAADVVGANNGTLVNWAGDETKWVPGRIGGGLRFNGGNDYVITDAAIDFTQYTIAFWLNVQEKANLNPRVVTPIGGKDGWVLINNEYGRGVGFYYNNGANTAQDPLPPTLDVWTHYAITFDRQASHADIYRDGVLVGSGVFGDGEPLEPWVFGHNGDLNNHVESVRGIMDDLRTYNGLISAETIFLLAGGAQITDVSTNTNELNEGEVLSLTGEFIPGILTDPYSVIVDWGDGTVPSHVDLAPGIGSFAIDHVIAEPPPNGELATILVTVVGLGPSATATRNVTVHNVNDLPVLANAISDQVATEDLEFSYTIPANTFADADWVDVLTLTAASADGGGWPAWLTFTASTTTFTGLPLNSDVGLYEIRVTATDGSNQSVSDTFTITVSNANDSPTLASPVADQLATEEVEFSFTLPAGTFADVDVGDLLTIAATKADGGVLPAWLSFSTSTGTFVGTPLNSDVGSLDVMVTATDSASATVSDLFTITVANVNDVPTLNTPLGDQSATEDSEFMFTVPTNTFLDIDIGDLLTLTAGMADGGLLPVWLMFNTSTATFSGTPLNADIGSIDIRVTATDGSFSSASDTFTLDIANTNDPPTLANPLADQNAMEDALFSFTLPANTFLDVDVGDSLSLSAARSGSLVFPPWLTFTASTGTFTGTPLNADVGSFDVRVTAKDSSNATISDTFTISVLNVNDSPTLVNPLSDRSATEDLAFSFTVPANTFADDDVGDTLVLTATRTDGTALPDWLSFVAATRRFTGTPLNDDVGVLEVRVSATDNGGADASDLFTITVANTNDVPTLANPISDQNANEDLLFSFTLLTDTFLDVDVGDSLTLTATRSNGSALPGWLTFLSSTGTFTGTPLDSNLGSFDVRVTAKDGSGTSVSDIFTIAVNNTNDAPTLVTPISDQIASEDSLFSFTVPAATFADIDVGDSLTLSATGSDDSALPNWLTFSASTNSFAGTPRNADVGAFDVKVTATDRGSASISETFKITVSNTNDVPTLASPLSDRSAQEDSLFTFSLPPGTFADVDIGDSLTLSASRSNGAALPGWLTFIAATGTFTGTPLNADVGSLDVKVTATDSGNASTSDTFSINVTNVNDAPTDMGLSGNSVIENVAGANIGIVTITDPDSGETHTLTVNDNRFEVVAGQLKLQASQSLDFETAASFSVSITARDVGGLELTKSFTIGVTNANDRPTSVGVSQGMIRERISGESVGTLSAVDQDSGQSHIFAVADQRFEITGTTLKLKDGQFLDITLGTTVAVQVTATDNGAPPLDFSGTLVLNVASNPSPWRNPVNPLDADNDPKHEITANDALAVINLLNHREFLLDSLSRFPFSRPANSPLPYYDVDGNNLLAPIDALLIINVLNHGSTGEGESMANWFAMSDGAPTATGAQALSVATLVPSSLSAASDSIAQLSSASGIAGPVKPNPVRRSLDTSRFLFALEDVLSDIASDVSDVRRTKVKWA